MKQKNTNEIDVIGEELVTKKSQKISVSYTLKAFSQNIARLSEAKMLQEQEKEDLQILKRRLLERWIGQEMEF